MAVPPRERRGSDGGSRHTGRGTAGQRLLAAFEQFETFPALRSSRDSLLERAAGPEGEGPSLVAAIERDPALAIAVLRAASSRAAQPPVAVPDALEVLSRAEITAAVERLPVFDFFEASATWSQTADRFRVHALTTQTAAGHLRRALGFGARPDLRVAALVHDLGKLILLRAYDRYEAIWDARLDPDAGVALERTELGFDHAAAGGVLARRLGLPKQLVAIIEHHHDEDAQGDTAIIRLADMLAHYASGELTNGSVLSAAGRAAGITPGQLRGALEALPGGAVAERHSDVPSPLSPRETQMLKKLAQGKRYQEIAAETGLHASTVRSHLHSTYRKLGVVDRAQAVLLATRHGWL